MRACSVRTNRYMRSRRAIRGPQGFAHRPGLPEKQGRYDENIHIQSREILHLRRLRSLSQTPFMGHLSASTKIPQR